MEKAIIINRREDIKYWNNEYSRVYLGSDFCAWLLPFKNELKDILKFASQKKIKITLLTPQLGSQELDRVKEIAKELNKKNLEEIVVNDYGALSYFLREFPESEIIVGRILSMFSAKSTNDNFMNRKGIRRIETDYPDIPNRIIADHISYYYPYSISAVTRYCSVVNIHNQLRNPGITACSQECLKIGELKIHNPLFKKTTILRGNAQLFERKVSFKKLEDKLVDRLVFQPPF